MTSSMKIIPHFQRLLIPCFAVLLALLFFVCPTHAETVLYKAHTLHPANAPAVSPGRLLVEDGVIKQIGTDIEPSADRTIDLGSAHLYPGLIALNTSLGLVEINAVRATRDEREVGTFTPEVESWKAVNPDSELLPVARANGITHFQPAPEGGRVPGTSGLLAIRPWTVEDMLVRAQVALHLNWPSMSLDLTPKSKSNNPDRWKSVEDQARERKKEIEVIELFFKEASAFKDLQANAHPGWKSMRPFVQDKRLIMVHANERRQILSALKWASDSGLSIAIAGGRDAWKCAKELADQKVPVLFEHVYSQPGDESDGYDIHFRAPSILAEAGVKVAIGVGQGGMEASNARNLPYHAAQAAAYGMDPQEALKSITLRPAEILGVDDRLGSLEPGKEATFFTASGSILDIRSNVQRLWIQGKETSLQSRHTKLYEKYRSRPKPGE